MMRCVDVDNESQIVLIIGDTLKKTFEITDENNTEDFYSTLNRVEFMCKELSIFKDLTHKGNNLWELRVESEITSQYKPTVTDYNIRLHYNDGTTLTASYRVSFEVLENTNER